jgi:ketosteroid isomerase-like protein
MRLLPVAGLLAVTTLVGCGGRRIPGTDIQDTSDTRAIVATIDGYRRAAERRDSEAVLALVSQKYFDDAGTPDPGDDIDYEQLKKRISDDFKNVSALRLDIAVRTVNVGGEEAEAFVFYDEHYRITTKAGEVAKQASDTHRMRFIREGGVWRFKSGL